ncbi:MAG: deoxyribonuclease IV [Lachnospiraceae bacterium]
MLRIGCHLSSSKGYLAMGKEAVKIGANTFQYFTRNPRGGKAKELDENDIKLYVDFAKEHQIDQILAHAPYILNACAKDEGLREFAYNIMCDDLRRLAYLPESMYNFHPGSHVQQGTKKGIAYISGMLNQINEKQEYHTTILLETMSGKGTEIGRNFEELREIINQVEDNSHLGVCLDTCHIFDGGYDIIRNLDQVVAEFDAVIGLERLKAVHLNDSKNPFNSHKDRHEKIGEGMIGGIALSAVINHPKLKHLPFFLETPNELDGYQQEITWLREQYISD